MKMTDVRKVLFYPEGHEFAGEMRVWLSGAMILGIILIGGYLEGLS